MSRYMPSILIMLVVGLSVASFSKANTEILESAIDSKLKSQTAFIKSQQKIDALVQENEDMVQQYRSALREIDSLKTYNRQLSKLIKQQTANLKSMRRQLDNIEETQRSIVPLMIKMIETLEQFIKLDLPFLKTEREARVALLKKTMDRPDVKLTDKYKRIMEAYQIEMEYGRTIEAYNDTIPIDGQHYTVDILRIGRLSMIFQTLDGRSVGIWNQKNKKWEPVGNEFNRSIKLGLQIAKKQAPPELVKLPIIKSK